MSEGLALREAAAALRRAKARRAFWLKQLYAWHWISSALCLVGMLLFALTGITLNHAGRFESKPVVDAREASLPPDLRALLATLPATGRAALPGAVSDWLAASLGVAAGAREAELTRDEVLLSLPRPGGDAFVSLGRRDGAVLHERTSRGWVSYLNDLHKGRNAGLAWSLFLDVFSGACLVFCLTGLVLLQFHSARRPATWPVVGLGLLSPVLLALLFIHA
ncbi:PepSY-associated TM helix domain-containing protein [Methylobacterium sp. Leaf466]|uniref:PepSY-associated TM helix domain-containing protein n=1 Tax=Methylobacterium sp. Leaf466 TaxID=1736386 RepID=UPI000B06F68A|nr:PepSY-associated TM helix domain-containing protein [Methylobacterium sp. Leaf466]